MLHITDLTVCVIIPYSYCPSRSCQRIHRLIGSYTRKWQYSASFARIPLSWVGALRVLPSAFCARNGRVENEWRNVTATVVHRNELFAWQSSQVCQYDKQPALLVGISKTESHTKQLVKLLAYNLHLQRCGTSTDDNNNELNTGNMQIYCRWNTLLPKFLIFVPPFSCIHRAAQPVIYSYLLHRTTHIAVNGNSLHSLTFQPPINFIITYTNNDE